MALKRVVVVILTVLGTILGLLAATILFFQIFFRGPWILYSVQSPSAEYECNQIRPGMRVDEALDIFTRKTEPFEQDYVENKISFSRQDGTCQIELDSGAKTVVRTSYEHSLFRIEDTHSVGR